MKENAKPAWVKWAVRLPSGPGGRVATPEPRCWGLSRDGQLGVVGHLVEHPGDMPVSPGVDDRRGLLPFPPRVLRPRLDLGEAMCSVRNPTGKRKVGTGLSEMRQGPLEGCLHSPGRGFRKKASIPSEISSEKSECWIGWTCLVRWENTCFKLSFAPEIGEV